MIFELVPHVSVGPIRFGMSKQAVRELFAAPPSESPHPQVECASDEWDELGIRVDYTPEGLCEAVLLVPPNAKVVFMGKRLLELPHSELCTWIQSADQAARFPNEGERSLASYTHGFMLGAPRAETPGNSDVAMAVFAWEIGYWDEV